VEINKSRLRERRRENYYGHCAWPAHGVVLLRHAMLHFAQREEPVCEHEGRRPRGLIS